MNIGAEVGVEPTIIKEKFTTNKLSFELPITLFLPFLKERSSFYYVVRALN